MIPGIPIAKYNAQAAGIGKSAPVSRDFQTLKLALLPLPESYSLFS